MNVEIDNTCRAEWLLSAGPDETYQTHSSRVLGDDGLLDTAHPLSERDPINDAVIDEPNGVIPNQLGR